MKKNCNLVLLALILVFSQGILAQSNFQNFKAGMVFNISLPDYMSKTIGLNSAATIQFKSVVKDVYGFVITDPKEDLALAEMKFGSVKEYAEDFINEFLKDEDQRKISKAVTVKKGEVNIVEYDASYYDKDSKIEIAYVVGLVETKNSFYKVLCWSAGENKEKFKADFEKIIYSIKE